MGFSTGQLATAGLAAQIGGAASSSIGAFYSAAGAKDTLKAQAAVSDINARMSEVSAQSELRRGQSQSGALTLKAGQMKAAQRARLSANGIALDEGSAVDIQASTDIMKEIDANTITSNAIQSAWGYRVQGTNYTNDAATRRAGASGISPFSAASTSLVSSAGTVASSWYSLNKEGALKGTVFDLAPKSQSGGFWS